MLFQVYKVDKVFWLDGSRVFSRSSDGKYTVWDVKEGVTLCEMNFGTAEVLGSAVRGDLLVAWCNNGSLRVVDLESGQVLQHLLHRDICSYADLSPNMAVLAVSLGGVVVLWDIRNGVKVKIFDLFSLFGSEMIHINNMEFNPSGDKLILASKDGGIFVVDME